MGRNATIEGEIIGGRGATGERWAHTLPVIPVTLGAAIFGLGVWQLFRAAPLVLSLSNILLGLALMPLAVWAKRRAGWSLQNPVTHLIVSGLLAAGFILAAVILLLDFLG